MASFPANPYGDSVAHIHIDPNTKYNPSKDTLTSPAMRSHLLSDEEIELLRSIDSNYRVAIHADVSDVEIYNDSDELVAIAPNLRKAFILVKAIYAAGRHTWTTKQLDRERRIAFRHGVTITPGTSLDEHELDFLPARAVVEVDGRVLQRTIRGWVTQYGNKIDAPVRGTFLGIIDKYFEAPFEDYGDEGHDTGCPYDFEDCCE